MVYAIPIPGHPCIPVCLSSCPFVSAAAICYSQQVRILCYVFLLLVSFVPYPISKFFGFHSSSFVFFVALFSGGVFFVVLSYPVRYHLICLPCFLSEVWFFSVSMSVTTEFVSLYDEESGRILGVLLMSLGIRNERFHVKFFSVSLSDHIICISLR